MEELKTTIDPHNEVVTQDGRTMQREVVVTLDEYRELLILKGKESNSWEASYARSKQIDAQNALIVSLEARIKELEAKVEDYKKKEEQAAW